MRCPKCGAFMEDGKDICLMCGTNVKTFGGPNMMSSNQPNSFNNFANNFNNANNNTNAFSANGFNNMNQGYNNFNNGNFNNVNYNQNFGSGMDSFGQGQGPSFPNQKNNFNNANDYRNVSYDNIKSEDKDIFDFFSENKKVLKFLGVLLLILGLSFAAYKYYEHRTKPAKIEPVMQNLYYEIDSSFQAVSENNNGAVIYSKSGDKGSACSISISTGSSTEGDHVKEYFSSLKKNLEPELDNNLNVVNELDIYTPQDSSFTLNNTTWYYLNIFYKKDKKSEPTTLRYKYMTSLYKGFYYDIALINNSNDAQCNASLDNFAKSLMFIDV